MTVTLSDEFVGPMLQRLATAQVDLAIIPYGDWSSEFEFEPLFFDELLIVAPRGHALSKAGTASFDEISRQPLLIMPRESSVWPMLEREFSSRGLPFKPAFEAQNLFTLIGLVEAGLGLTLLPRIIMPRLNLNAVGTVRIGGGIRRHIGIVKLRGRALPAVATAFARATRDAQTGAGLGECAGKCRPMHGRSPPLTDPVQARLHPCAPVP